MPSAAHETWFKQAAWAVGQWRTSHKHNTISESVNVRALFYREALTGDTCGYYQALADLLERTGVLENDRLIASWDGSRLLKSKDAPRIEVEITATVVIPPRGEETMIDGLTEEKAAAISDAALYRCFCAYSRYRPDAPPATKYVIRVGVTFIYAADTMKLRMAFERHVGKLKRGKR